MLKNTLFMARLECFNSSCPETVEKLPYFLDPDDCSLPYMGPVRTFSPDIVTDFAAECEAKGRRFLSADI